VSFCSQCGVALGSTDKFCGSCGTRLSESGVPDSGLEAKNRNVDGVQVAAELETGASEPQQRNVDSQKGRESVDSPVEAKRKRVFWRNAVLAFLGVGVVAAIITWFTLPNSSNAPEMQISEGCYGCTPAQLENIRENKSAGAAEICESVERLEELWESPGDITDVWYANNRLSLRISTSDLDADSELVILAKAMHDTFKVLQAFANEGPQTEEEVEIMEASLDTLDSAFNVTLRQCEIEGVS